VRVALYARVSTERQEQLGTIASQRAALRQAAREQGWQVIEEFVDDGHSGARLDRPALDRLRDAVQAGLIEMVVCLAADRLARAYAYQVLILEEFERFGVQVRFLEGPAPSQDPQANLLLQMQGVIAEYERAKIAERYRRGKLHRARQGEPFFWKVPYGYRRIPGEAGRPARLEILESEARVVRNIFRAFVDEGRSLRQIALDLYDRGIPSPTGNATWASSTMGRLIRNEAYIGTIYYNRRESIKRPDPTRGRQHAKMGTRERPKEEWIPIPVPAILDEATFERARNVSRDNSKFNPRGAEPGVYLLRGLIECGHCHVSCSCHKMRGRNGHTHRYYYCRNHDILNAGGQDRRCPERNIRSHELDTYVYDQVRQALLDPHQLTQGETAILQGTPPSDEALLTAQLERLDRRLAHTQQERARLLDAYQAGLIPLPDLTRRTKTITTRQHDLTTERDTLRQHRTQQLHDDRLQQDIHTFAERIARNLDELDFHARQKLMRLVIEKVRVTGWRVEIHLKIPLDKNTDTPNPTDPPQPHTTTSSDMNLRPAHIDDVAVVQEPVEDGRGENFVACEHVGPLADALVAGDDGRSSLVPVADDFEQEVRVAAVEGLKAELVDDQHGCAHELPAVGPAVGVLVVPAHLLDQMVGCGEGDAEAVLDGSDAEALREVALANAGRSEEQHVLFAFRELGGGEQVDLVLVDTALEREVVVVKGFREA